MSRRYKLSRLSEVYEAIEAFESRRSKLITEIKRLEEFAVQSPSTRERHRFLSFVLAFNQRCLIEAREWARAGARMVAR